MNSNVNDCQKNTKDFHIALSLESRYWPQQSTPVLFDYGSYGSASKLHSESFLMATSPWQTDTQIIDATHKVNSYYDLLLQVIYNAFNEVFHIKKSKRYYRILLGPILYWMLNVFYDRFFRVRAIYKEFPNIKFPVTDYNRLNFNLYDFVVMAKTSEHYNANIINYITRNLNEHSSYSIHYDHACVDVSKKNLFSDLSQTVAKYKLYARAAVYKVCYKISLIFVKKLRIMFYGVDIPIFLSDVLKYKLYWFLGFSPRNLQKKTKRQKDDRVREKLHILMKKYLFAAHDNFLECFLEFFINELPLVYLENYCLYDIWSKKQQQKNTTDIICSSTGWYFDEYFKYFSAWSADQGTKLVGFQHGGDYQIMKKHFSFEHEKKVTDLYFTLGKEDKKNDTQDVWLPRKFKLQQAKVKIVKKNILFVSTSPCRFLMEFPITTDKSDLYIKTQLGFLSYLQTKYSKDLVYRPYHVDNVWKLKECVRELFPKLKIDSNSNFSLSLSSSRLLIFDHLSTTFLESLALNKPTILCWPKTMYYINKNLENYFDDLVKCQILHNCYKKAVVTLEKAFSVGIENWWFDSERQKCLQIFLDKFLLGNSNHVIVDKLTILNKIQKIHI